MVALNVKFYFAYKALNAKKYAHFVVLIIEK